MIASDRHSSLFWPQMNDKEKGNLILTTGTNFINILLLHVTTVTREALAATAYILLIKKYKGI